MMANKSGQQINKPVERAAQASQQRSGSTAGSHAQMSSEAAVLMQWKATIGLPHRSLNGMHQASALLEMQRRYGNATVQRMLNQPLQFDVEQANGSKAVPAPFDTEPSWAERVGHGEHIPLQRACDPSVASCPSEPASFPTENAVPQQSSTTPDSAQTTYRSARETLLQQGPDIDPRSSAFQQYGRACEALASSGEPPSDEPTGVLIPADRMLAVGESGQVELLSGSDLVVLGEDLFPVLDDVASASQTGQLPAAAAVNPMQQVLLWSDGRAAFVPPLTADLATLLIQGQPATFDAAEGIGGLDKPWERVRDAGMHSVLTSGLYQLGSHPLSHFNGVSLPPGSRIKFADVGRLMQGQMETRLVTVFQRGTNRYYAWDAHLPVGNQPHSYWHVNQKGMSSGLFGQANHSPLTPGQIAQARNLRYIRVGGRVLFVAGILVDGYALYNSAAQSVEQETPRPVVAQVVRTVGGWGGAWAGAKLGCAGGALAGAETGPGLVLTCIAGGIVGGFAGYAGADWIADMISED